MLNTLGAIVNIHVRFGRGPGPRILRIEIEMQKKNKKTSIKYCGEKLNIAKRTAFEETLNELSI